MKAQTLRDLAENDVDKDILAHYAPAIKAWAKELVGENEYVEGMAGDDKTMTRYADSVRDEIRERIHAS